MPSTPANAGSANASAAIQFSARHIVPTAEQRAVQTSDARSILIQANAGAAKTTTLALRMAEGLARGMHPKRMLALTATEPACEALRLALLKIGVPVAEVKNLWISSFERFAAYCLHSAEGARPALCTEPEQLQDTVWDAVAELREGRHTRWPEQLVLPPEGDRAFVEAFLQTSLWAKGSLTRELLFWDGRRVSPELCDEEGLDFTAMCLLGVYEQLRCPPGDDLPLFRAPQDASYDLARRIADPEQPDALDLIPTWPRQVHMLLLDEMHDLSPCLFAIVRALLASNPRALFCGVGDRDQVLHARAGADARSLDPAFFTAQTGREVKTLPLTASYRFSAELAELAGQFAHKPYASQAPHASLVTTLAYVDDGDCVQQVLAQLNSWGAQGGKRADCAVLLRHAHQTVLLENALCEAGITYHLRGFSTYLQRPEVLLVRALLAIATRDFAAVQSLTTRQRMVEQLVAFCGVELSFEVDASESAQDRLAIAVDEVARDPTALVPFFEGQILRNAEPALARRLRAAVAAATETGFAAMLDALDLAAWAPWVERQRRADAFAHLDGLRMAAQNAGSAAAFFALLNRAELAQEGPGAKAPAGSGARAGRPVAAGKPTVKTDSLCLADIAAVKGLEFEHVLLPFLAQDEFPARERRSMQDEKNLFYVGLTRARTRLTLLAHGHKPSGFLGEL